MNSSNSNSENKTVDSPPPRLEVEKIGELLKELCITRSNLNLYSFEHEVPRQSLRDTLRAINLILEVRPRISIDITKTALLFEGLPMEERNPMVGHLAQDLRNLRVNGFTFLRGVTLRELAIFFKLLTLKQVEVEQMGGARALLDELKVEHIGINQARFVRLEDDKKIVSKGDRVLSSREEDEQSMERELINDLVKALMGKKADRDWLLDEVRTDPAKVAKQMVAMIKYFDDQDVVQDQESRQEALDALMGSIKVLGNRLSERDESDQMEESDDGMARAMVLLEQELKTRSAGLKSSKAVTRFVEEITSTVTAFIDNYQTNIVAKEYLKDEKGLKRTEQLLRNIMKRKPGESSIPRIEKLLLEKGLSEKDLEKLLDHLFGGSAKPEKRKPIKKRKPRKWRAPKPVKEKIEKALVKKLETLQDKEETAAYLAGVFQREVGAKLKGAKEEKKRLTSDLQQVDEVLSQAGLGLVVLDEDGRIIMRTRPAQEIMGEESKEKLDSSLMEFIAGGESDSIPARDDFLNRQPPEARGRFRGILEAMDHPIINEDGDLLGLILSPPSLRSG